MNVVKRNTYEELDIVFQDSPKINNTAIKTKQSNKIRGYKELVLDLLEKSPEVGRLLVKLHDRNMLYIMAKSPDDMARAELTQTIVDLLSFELTPAEDELIADVLMSLIQQAERDLRRSLAERLAVMEDVPLRIVLNLASDEIFVADSVLRKSADLKDFDLIYILKAKDKEHWQSIAKRPEISDKLITMLADTNDLGTAINLTYNKAIRLNSYVVSKFFEMAKESDNLAKPLLMREELLPEMASTLYKFVGEELKTYIRENFGATDFVDAAIDEITSDFALVDNGNYKPTPDMVVQAELLMEKGFLNSGVMVESLRSGQIASFVAQFSVYCGLPVETVNELIKQKTAQGMAVACKAMVIAKSDFINMFLLTSRVRGARIIDENDLSRAISYYDRVSETLAKSLLNKQRH